MEVAARLEKVLGRYGFVAFLGAGVSLATCYYKLFTGWLATLLGGSTLTLNIHVQAVIMWVFVLIAVVGLFYDRRLHGRSLPLAMGAGAFILIFATLYAYYDPRLEVMGYVLLIVAVFLNQ